MSSTLVGSNDHTVNTSAITGYKAGGSSLYSNKEGYDRQNSYSKETGSGWGSISPRKGEGMQWQQQKQAEQGLIGKLLDSNTSQIERTRYSGLYSVPVSPSAGRTQAFSSQSSAMQSSQSALPQTQQQPVSLNKQQQFIQQQPVQQQQFVQQQQQFAQPQQFQQQQFAQPQQVQQSAPVLQKQQSMTQVSSLVNQQSSLPLTQQQHWTQPNKTLWASETGPVTIQQPPVCLPLEALIIKPEPIMVPQEPVVFQPEAIQVAQPPIVFRPEPITIPMPPLTIQPEPVVVQRPPVMFQPPPIVLRRPDVQMNPVFSLALKYGCSTTNDVACSTDQCVPISSLTPSQQAGLSQTQFNNSNASSLSQTRPTRSQSFTMQ